MTDQVRLKKKLHDLWKDNCCYLGRLRLSAAVMLAMSFTFLFFGPLEIVAFSGGSLVYSHQDILPVVLVLFAVGMVTAPLLALLKGRIFHYTMCVVSACTLGGYLQALLLNGGLGLLTGDAIDWSKHAGTAILSLLLPVLLLVALLLAMYLHRKFWYRLLCAVSLLLVAMQLVPTISILCGAYDEAKPDKLTGYYLSERELTSFSQEDNVFVFVLDRLDYDYIEKCLKLDPHFLDGLDGFTSYTNAISAYARTQPALAHLLTASESTTYLVPEQQFYDDIWKGDTNILRTLQDEGYSVDLYTNIRNLFSDPDTAAQNANNATNGKTGLNYPVLAGKLLQLSTFRYAPTALKPFFWADTNYYNTDVYHSDGSASYQFNDPEYARMLANATADSDTPAFRMYHFYGSHAPYNMNADGTASETDTSVTAQTVGSFVNLLRIFDHMKQLGIYEDATIIITGDHGSAMYDTRPLVKATRIGLFYKPSGSAGTPLTHSAAPVSTANIPATLAKAAGANYHAFGTPLDEVAEDAVLTRTYYKTVCDTQTYRETQLCIYRVTGDAADFNNWELVDLVDIPYSYN